MEDGLTRRRGERGEKGVNFLLRVAAPPRETVPLSLISASALPIPYASRDASLLLMGAALGIPAVVLCLRFVRTR